jgi:hypothetical protein
MRREDFAKKIFFIQFNFIFVSVDCMQSPSSGSSDATCSLCDAEFSVTRLRHRCRKCNLVVCNQCSGSRYRVVPNGQKERVCDICARELQTSHSEELEETADVRQKINESLKLLLKEKYEKIEEIKRFLLNIISENEYLQEPPSIDSPPRFSLEFGASRISFSQLVDYLEDRLRFLKNRTEEIRDAIDRDSAELAERRQNFEYLKERTRKAELDATRASELVHQQNRLREIFREQSSTIRALQDRAEMLENQQLSRGLANLIVVPPLPLDVVEENEFVGDRIIAKVFPCL